MHGGHLGVQVDCSLYKSAHSKCGNQVPLKQCSVRWARYWWEMDAYLPGNYHKQNGQHAFQRVNSEFHQEAL